MHYRHAIALLLLLSGLPKAGGCVLTLAYNEQSSPPYIAGDGADVPASPGIAIELVQKAVAGQGCRLQLVRRPGKRALVEVERGQFDGLILYSYTAERGRTLVYPLKKDHPDAARRLATLSHYLYQRRGNRVEWDGKTLRAGRQGPIGINRGFGIRADLEKLGAMIEEANSTEQNLNKLKLGRIVAYAMQDNIADHIIAEGDYAMIEKLPQALQRKDYYLAFSRRFYLAHRPLAERIWDDIGRQRDTLLKSRLPDYLQ